MDHYGVYVTGSSGRRPSSGSAKQQSFCGNIRRRERGTRPPDTDGLLS